MRLERKWAFKTAMQIGLQYKVVQHFAQPYHDLSLCVLVYSGYIIIVVHYTVYLVRRDASVCAHELSLLLKHDK